MKNSNTLNFNGQTIVLKSTNLVDLQKELSTIRDSFFSDLVAKASKLNRKFTIEQLCELDGGNLKPAQIQYYCNNCNKSKFLGYNIEKNVDISNTTYFQVDVDGQAIPNSQKSIEEKIITYSFN